MRDDKRKKYKEIFFLPYVKKSIRFVTQKADLFFIPTDKNNFIHAIRNFLFYSNSKS